MTRDNVTELLDPAAGASADIEQAKGALMIVHAISADDAFDILRWHSSHANMKLRDLAILITEAIASPGRRRETPAQLIGRILGRVVNGDEETGTKSTRKKRQLIEAR